MSLFKQKIINIAIFSLIIAGAILDIISIVQTINNNYENALLSLVIGVICLFIPIFYFEISNQ